MHLADLTTPAAKIHSALDDLQLAWSTATGKWNDVNSRKFEEEWLQPMALMVRLGLDAVGRMNEVLRDAERQVQ